MKEKTYEWGGTRLTLEQLREVDPIHASNIDAETPPLKESKSDRMFSDMLTLWFGVWLGGIVVWMIVK